MRLSPFTGCLVMTAIVLLGCGGNRPASQPLLCLSEPVESEPQSCDVFDAEPPMTGHRFESLEFEGEATAADVESFVIGIEAGKILVASEAPAAWTPIISLSKGIGLGPETIAVMVEMRRTNSRLMGQLSRQTSEEARGARARRQIYFLMGMSLPYILISSHVSEARDTLQKLLARIDNYIWILERQSLEGDTDCVLAQMIYTFRLDAVEDEHPEGFSDRLQDMPGRLRATR